MKITKMNLYTVPPRWLFLEVETDGGITGWGSRWWHAADCP